MSEVDDAISQLGLDAAWQRELAKRFSEVSAARAAYSQNARSLEQARATLMSERAGELVGKGAGR